MKKRKFKFRYVIYGLLMCYVGYVLLNQQLMISRIKNDISKYAQQNQKVQESNAYLKDQIEFAKTEEYKEKVARERIGLIKPGETVYIIDNQD